MYILLSFRCLFYLQIFNNLKIKKIKTQKNKLQPLQSGINSHSKSGKPVLYLYFDLDNVVYYIYENLPIEDNFYYRLNSLELIIKYFGGVRNLRSLVKKLTADQVPEIEFKPKQYCDA